MRAREMKQRAHGVAQEATVATILAVPVAERNGFTAGRARTVGMDAAVESVLASVTTVLAELPVETTRDDVLAALEALRAGLVAERPRGYRTQAEPESLLNVPEFAEALYRIWAIHDWRDCRWDLRTETCTVHPNFSSYTRQCQFAAAAEFLRAMGVDPDTDQIPKLMDEVQARLGVRREFDGKD